MYKMALFTPLASLFFSLREITSWLRETKLSLKLTLVVLSTEASSYDGVATIESVSHLQVSVIIRPN